MEDIANLTNLYPKKYSHPFSILKMRRALYVTEYYSPGEFRTAGLKSFVGLDCWCWCYLWDCVSNLNSVSVFSVTKHPA